MRIRVQKHGDYFCVPFPASISDPLRLAEGAVVEVVLDQDRGQIFIKPAGSAPEQGALEQDFAPAVEALLQRHAQALSELAGL
jgi:bifunctional DNA-binding transcriptional regulator/antitoxin component of YhaV-PrlF toxin-antitoxin module